jgi:transcriptional regulator with XRE-family HTH domain
MVTFGDIIYVNFNPTKGHEQGGKRLGISQKELAEMVGTKQPTIARIETGENNTTIDMLAKIAYATNQKLNINFS